jgi:hypothetical protein
MKIFSKIQQIEYSKLFKKLYINVTSIQICYQVAKKVNLAGIKI